MSKKLTSEQLKIIEELARNSKPTLVVAKEGIQENIVFGVRHRWGMVKIRFNVRNRGELKKLAQDLADRTSSELLFMSGDCAVYFRKHPQMSMEDLLKERNDS